MVHTEGGNSIIFITRNVQQDYLVLHGPFPKLEPHSEIPPYIINSIIERTNCLAAFPNLSRAKRQIAAAIKMTRPDGSELEIRSPPSSQNVILTIRAFIADEEGIVPFPLASRLYHGANAAVTLFLLSVRLVPEGRTVITAGTLADTLRPCIKDGDKLDFEFDKKVFLYTSLTAVADVAKAALNLNPSKLAHEEWGVWDLCKDSLPGQRVGATYDKKVGTLVALVVVQKVVVTVNGVQYVDIAENEGGSVA